MNLSKSRQLALFALLAAGLPAVPAGACCGMSTPHPHTPTPSVRPPSIPIPRTGVDSATQDARNAAEKKKKVITQDEWNEKYKNAFNKNKGKDTDDAVSKKIMDALDDKYVVGNQATLKLPPDVKTPAQIKDFLQKKLDAEQAAKAKKDADDAAATAAAWKAHNDAEAQRNRPPPQVREPPITLEELARRNRVNKGEEAPRPGDEKAPWFQDTR